MMKLKIESPCNQDWNKMKAGEEGRHCDSCQKEVIDFTKNNKGEIEAYINSHQGKQICGRIKRKELERPIKIKSYQTVFTNKLKIACLGSLLLLNCEQPKSAVCEQPLLGLMLPLPVEFNSADTASLISDSIEAPMLIGDIVVGGIEIDELETEAASKIYSWANPMPEFPGGEKALFKYLRDFLVYPQWEQDNNIEGRVVVKFIVDTLGDIKEINILRSVPKSRNFDAEVIRVLQNMPKWIPGKDKGELVEVYYSMPIKFSLH